MSCRTFGRLTAVALALTIPLATVPVAAAETSPTVSAVSNDTVDEAALAAYFETLDNSQSNDEARLALDNLLGKETADQAIRENSSNSLTGTPRGAGTFLTCVKGKASDDIKGVFDVNAVAAAIGQKNYAKAAAEAVKCLAKQGIKWNVTAVAAMFAYWGWQYRGSW